MEHDVHLENGQHIYFTEEKNMQSATAEPPETTLTAFFKLCQEDLSVNKDSTVH